MGTPLLLGAGTFGGVSYDADAQNYFNANTSITSTADKNAINTFYLGLKSDGIYTKIKAMYLPIWGSAASCKWNLVNPVDTNAAFRLSFSTGWTFSSGGMTPNGTSAYVNTFLTPSTALSLNSVHLSHYSRSNVADTGHDIGASILTSEAQYMIIVIKNSNTSYYGLNVGQAAISSTTVSNTDSKGFYIGSRTASNALGGFKNSSKVLNVTTASNTIPTVSVFIGALNYGGSPTLYSSKQCSFSSIGTGLTDTEAANFYTRVNTLMTYFGINV